MATSIAYDELIDIADTADIDGDHVHLNYCGRGMVGYAGEPSRTCLGITGSIEDYGRFAVELALREAEANEDGTDLGWTAAAIIRRTCTDGMGHDTIFYFPGVAVTEVPDHATS